MNTRIIELPEIAIIGKEGLCTESSNIVQELWAQANSHFDEVAELGMKEKDGSFVGFWGAMSDETMSFKPWTNNFSRGLYLAGIEVNKDAVAPKGWTKWVMPARKYLVVDVQMDKYGEIFSEVLNSTIPDMNLRLCGAVCDYTEPASGKNMMFFPVTETNIKVIEFFSSDNKQHWFKQMQQCDWGAGKWLGELLQNGKLQDIAGADPLVPMVTEGDKLISFCTLAPLDEIQPTDLTPWIGFVYTFPEFRGNRYAGQLLSWCEGEAARKGQDTIYISTDHIGLYEKYGYEFYQMMKNVGGEDCRIYRKALKKKR